MKSLRSRRQMRNEIDEQDEAYDDVELFEAWKPLLKRLGKKPKETSGAEIVDIFGPLGVLVLAKVMLYSKNDRAQVVAAKEMAYMSGLKPVERSQSLNVNVMADAELDAMLRSKLGELGIKVIDEGDDTLKSLASPEAVAAPGR